MNSLVPEGEANPDPERGMGKATTRLIRFTSKITTIKAGTGKFQAIPCSGCSRRILDFPRKENN